MDLAINSAKPEIMHIDLNSAFAMIEQQANPLLRGKPVVITNRLTRGATIIAASYEAKAYGIGVGNKLTEAQAVIPNVVALETDPPKYIYAYKTFQGILSSYSPDSQMKSVDEGIIDFSTTRLINTRRLEAIGYEIKAKLQAALGEWVTCNVGIAPNRFLAKLAAGLNKPDGLDVIDSSNLLKTLRGLKLIDLPGINIRYAVRLNLAGIYTPLDFVLASKLKLTREVFRSINGHFWYLRLRGYEVDSAQFTTKSVGRQYVLHEWTADDKKLAPILMKMCEGMGRRLRAKGLCARGIFVGSWFLDPPAGGGRGFKARKTFKTKLFTSQELFDRVWWLFKNRPKDRVVKGLSVTCFNLAPASNPQLNLFETADTKQWQLTRLIDELNDRYGEFMIHPGIMANTKSFVPEKIPFGSTRHFRN